MTATTNTAETREYTAAGMTCSHCVLSVRWAARTGVGGCGRCANAV